MVANKPMIIKLALSFFLRRVFDSHWADGRFTAAVAAQPLRTANMKAFNNFSIKLAAQNILSNA